MLDPFTRHPHAVGETYGEHLATAATFGLTMIVAGLACLVHALAPFLFQTTASDCIESLHERMAARMRGARRARAHLPPFTGGGDRETVRGAAPSTTEPVFGPASGRTRGWSPSPAAQGRIFSA